MTSHLGPVVHRVILIKELRALRRGSGMAESALAARLGWSPGRLARVENWTSQSSADDLETLLRFHGLDAERKQEMRNLARRALEPGWWETYQVELEDPGFRDYLAYEGAATSIKSVETLLLPAPLQTEAYAWAVLREFWPNASPERLDALTELRSRRRRSLGDQDDQRVRQVHLIDEAAIQRRVAPTRVLVEQLDRLLGEAGGPRITVQVLPWDVEHSAFKGPFWLLECEEGVDDVLHLERTPRSSTYTGVSPEIAEHHVAFAELQESALDPGPSLELIRRRRDELAAEDDG